jgi:hypothetical protein
MMNHVHRFRVILDDDRTDVFRDLVLDPTSHLEDLHFAILQAFDLTPGEMASFFLSDENWEQGDEIHLEAFEADARTMAKTPIAELPGERCRLLYLYDFMHLWTFFVERISTDETHVGNLPAVVSSVGIRPAQAPGKDFDGADPKGGLFDDAFGDEHDPDDDFDADDIAEGFYEE